MKAKASKRMICCLVGTGMIAGQAVRAGPYPCNVLEEMLRAAEQKLPAVEKKIADLQVQVAAAEQAAKLTRIRISNRGDPVRRVEYSKINVRVEELRRQLAAAKAERAVILEDIKFIMVQFQSWEEMGGCDGDGQKRVCGGAAGIHCEAGEFCRFPPESCGSGNQRGECMQMSEGCTAQMDPVCGCDGITYSNMCMALVFGVNVASKGTCPR